MPILCPGAGSLLRLGKHSRHGGQRSNSRHSSSGSRHVNARGTLAHQFTQKQVELGPPMSPGSAGGVYLGPEKKDKVSCTTTTTTSSSVQDKKLAEIRSPTDYYTDGNVFIGQDVTKDVEVDTKPPSEHPDILHPMRSEQSRLNDTLNPDGTLASIVFFEETFMSNKFSNLSTSSPARPVNRSRTLDTTNASQFNQSGFGYIKRGKDSSIIPSWVRQRRCLPTLDEVDFDQIDLISLHSLPTNEGQQQALSPDRASVELPLKVADTNEQTYIVNAPLNINRVDSKEGVARPRSQIDHKINDDHKSQKQRSVLGDLTNKDNSPAPNGTSKVTSQSAFYKIPKRSSARERRSRRNRRISNNRRMKPSSSRESLVNALDKPNEHTYVNLEYIAGIMTNSPPKDGSKKMDESIHDYENIWSKSPAKSVAVQRRMKHSMESGVHSRTSPAVNNTTKRNGRVSQNRRSDQGHKAHSKLSSKPDLFVDLPPACPSPRISQNSAHNGQDAAVVLKSYMMGIKETIIEDSPHKKEALSSTSSWESATNSHSTEGEECAAILYGGARNKTPQVSGTIRERKQIEKSVRNPTVPLGRKGDAITDSQQIPDEGNGHVTDDSESRRLVETPSFVDNAIRKARIVRTNSVEESSREVQDVSAKPKTSNRRTDFKPKNSSHVENRRSLPAPSTLPSRSPLKTPQRRSTTNVRAVEAKLNQKQNRKIRRTVEGDEVLEALLIQEQSEPPQQHRAETKTNERCSESGETLPGDRRGSRDEMSRVQRIIEHWNQSSKRIAQRHGSMHYVGGHIHTTSTGRLPDQNPSQPVASDRGQVGKSGVKWMKGAWKNENNGKESGNPKSDARTSRAEVNQSSIRRIPTTYSTLPKTQNRKLTSPSVVEVYVTTEAYSPAEVDEIEVQRGEIVVVNSAMQRENDWMWVYVPRSDRFGYLPAFAARPLEFQVNEV